MNFQAKQPGFRYAPMIVKGGVCQVMVYDNGGSLLSILQVSVSGGGYLISGNDPGRGRRVKTSVAGISAFDAARKFCDGVLV